VSAFGIYVFDLYGTLVDYGSLRSRFVGRVADPDAFVATWRQKQLQYALTATLMERYVDFDTLTDYAFAYAAALHAMEYDPAFRDGSREAWSSLPAFADVADALEAVRERGIRTAVLSNGTPRAIAATLASNKLTHLFDAAISVDSARNFKPRPAVYSLATERFGVPREQIAFVSSNGWDATGASEFGFQTIWCNRAGLPAETFGKPPARTISTLAALLDE
jgi:2-haloacid dehalogenase